MKTLLLLVLVGIVVGTRSRSLRWKELGAIAGIVGLIVAYETFNILFRYIGVE